MRARILRQIERPSPCDCAAYKLRKRRQLIHATNVAVPFQERALKIPTGNKYEYNVVARDKQYTCIEACGKKEGGFSEVIRCACANMRTTCRSVGKERRFVHGEGAGGDDVVALCETVLRRVKYKYESDGVDRAYNVRLTGV